MGLRDLFRRRKPDEAPLSGGRRFRRDSDQTFDPAAAEQLAQLLAAPRETRDDRWTEQFYHAAWMASVVLPEQQVYRGPDGFSYLRLDPDPSNSAAAANTADGLLGSLRAYLEQRRFADLADHCLANQLGAAFFISADDPVEAAAFVLTFGVIDSLVRYDSPDGDPLDADGSNRAGHHQFIVDRPRDVLIGTPSADYLPPYTARALCDYFERAWGVADPRVHLINDPAMPPGRHLVIGMKLSQFPDEAVIANQINSLFWFLPPGRSIVLMPEDWSLSSMTPLRALF